MKKVYIVSDNTYLFGVHKTKKGALKTKRECIKHNYSGVYIKRRVNTLRYLNILD